MGAGEKTELVTIQREARTRQPGGSFTSEWQDLTTVWASADWVRGGETERQGTLRAMAVYRFTVYGEAIEDITPPLGPGDRIVWNDEPYNIRERPRRQIGKPEIDIIADTGVTQ